MDINSTSSNSAAATTTPGKLLPILPAFPKKPNLHALLGSTGALNLQGIAEMSENEYFDSSAADESSSPMATSPLRTQEILLFYFVSLLLHLAKDSHRVRHCTAVADDCLIALLSVLLSSLRVLVD